MRKGILLVAVLLALTALGSEITPGSVVAAMNARRAGAGLPPLREDARLDRAAADRITDMEDQSYWAHIAPDGRSPFDWLAQRGYDYANAGENLASGFETTEVLLDAWMESPGHRDNILSPLFEDCGVGIVDGSTTGRAIGRSIVVMFGRPRTAPAQRQEQKRAAVSAPSTRGRFHVPTL